mmetsp:Transcript_22223/g.56063  ORF Transcript_22223/g.56063 Transcript_22223/m.56063 type:complete len:233 (-) Transcript_22223:1063-1761(-)
MDHVIVIEFLCSVICNQSACWRQPHHVGGSPIIINPASRASPPAIDPCVGLPAAPPGLVAGPPAGACTPSGVAVPGCATAPPALTVPVASSPPAVPAVAPPPASPSFAGPPGTSPSSSNIFGCFTGSSVFKSACSSGMAPILFPSARLLSSWSRIFRYARAASRLGCTGSHNSLSFLFNFLNSFFVFNFTHFVFLAAVSSGLSLLPNAFFNASETCSASTVIFFFNAMDCGT